jgi:two-component system, NtrC family, sensor kinase
MLMFNRLPFRAKITLGITALVVLFGSLSAILVGHLAAKAMLTEIKKRGQSLGLSLAARTADPLLALDFLRLKNMVDEVLSSSDDIDYVFIQDVRGEVLAHTYKDGFPVELKDANPIPAGNFRSTLLLDTGEGRVYDFALAVVIGHDRLGTVRVGLSQVRAETAVQRLLLIILGITGGVGVVAILMGTWFSGTVTRRLNLLRRSAEEMIRGNLEVQTGPVLTRNCWEIKECTETKCPAYGDTHHRCWTLPGTLCPDCAPGVYQEKIGSCGNCGIFREISGDEIQSLAEAFDVMALSLNRNIAELKEAERSLTRQQMLLKTMMEATPDLVSLQDDNLVYRAVNPAFCQFFSFQENDVLGKGPGDIFPPDEAEDHQAEDLHVIKTAAPISREALMARDHRRHWLHLVKVPVYDEQRVAWILSTARDITDIKQYQEKLVHSVRMEQLGRLAGGVAHEINTPLGIILGYTQMLLDDLVQDAESHEYLQIIEKQTHICRRVVADLLGFSRQMESSMEETDLNASIAEVLQLVRHPFKQNWIEIEESLDPGIPLIIGDRERLKQVWINLLNNASDAIGRDGAIRVKTRLCPLGHRVLVSVADSGSGIAQEDLKRLFEPFFTTKPPGAGTGLGLSVSMGIIQGHQGNITAISPVPPQFLGQPGAARKPYGPGSVFLVELPVASVGPQEDSCDEIWRDDASAQLPGIAKG